MRPPARRSGVWLAVALVLSVWSAGTGRAVAEALHNVPAPEIVLDDLEGRTWTLEELRQDGLLLLDFGSVFCAACQEALRWLETARREFGPRGLAVAAVNVDGPKAAGAVATVTRSLNLGYPVLLDGDGSVAEAYGVDVIPYLVLVDAGGNVRAVHRGLTPDLAEILGLDAALAAGGDAR